MNHAELLARTFHETYEKLAPEHGYRTREESAVPWDQVPEANRRLMVATCGAILSMTRPYVFLTDDHELCDRQYQEAIGILRRMTPENPADYPQGECFWCQAPVVNGLYGEPDHHDPSCPWVDAEDLLYRLTK